MDLSNGSINLKGRYEIKHIDKNGNLISYQTIDNTITNTGKAEVAGLINEVTSIGFKWIALDSSSTAATNTDTTLASEITSPSLKRFSATTSRVTTNVTNDTSQLLKTYSSTASQAVKGAGIFDSSSGGVMLSRVTFATKNLVSGDTLQVTYKIVIS